MKTPHVLTKFIYQILIIIVTVITIYIYIYSDDDADADDDDDDDDDVAIVKLYGTRMYPIKRNFDPIWSPARTDDCDGVWLLVSVLILKKNSSNRRPIDVGILTSIGYQCTFQKKTWFGGKSKICS